MLPVFYNTCWMAACHREARAYHRATGDVAQTQARVLRRIIRGNRDCWFGEQHRFAAIHNVRDFRDAVPLSNYDDYRSAVDRIARGERQVLTAESIELLEPTGGSTAGEKLIPYTASLRRSFQRAIRVWIWDLFSTRPKVRRGTAYWSISPLLAVGRTTSGGVRIGFDDDAAYLGTLEKHLVERTMAVPPAVALCPSIASCRYATLFFLLRDPRLSLISVWSPTFLTELLKSLWIDRDALCDDVGRGKISTSMGNEDGPLNAEHFTPLPSRAKELKELFREAGDVSACVRAVWPRLSVISCWADGPSSTYAHNLSCYLDGIEIQPKGLLATEAFVSVPLTSQPAPALAIRSHFYEFVPADSKSVQAARPLLAHELEPGARYEVVVTTQGGLYRYQLHDQIEVVGFYRDTPLLKFIGKADATSDLVGEKLNDAQVEYALRAAFEKLELRPRFAQLTADAAHASYVLRLFDDSPGDWSMRGDRLAAIVDAGLSSNSAYRYARELGQLQCVRVELMQEAEADSMVTSFLTSKSEAGRRFGDIKATTLVRSSDAIKAAGPPRNLAAND
ncbi:MAG: GH3 auxin-responsive promoter family protein [Pirellulales bacterium]|nr:GH3 auxin-responsive promoter family protein [Pirellulales bacterium]